MNIYICPECKGNPLEEKVDGFTICGLCKGTRSVEGKDESYHHETWSLFRGRNWTDVVRVWAIERDSDKKLEKDFLFLSKFHKKNWLGYRAYYKKMIQNDVNYSK